MESYALCKNIESFLKVCGDPHNKIKTILPNWIDVNTSVNVKKLKFKSFESSNLTSKISLNNNILQLDSLETDLLNGIKNSGEEKKYLDTQNLNHCRVLNIIAPRCLIVFGSDSNY